jgi:CubicO group peptidase (beta-lactamase class C family)
VKKHGPLSLPLAVFSLLLSASIASVAQVPQFAMSPEERKAKLMAAMPEVEKVFERYHTTRRTPGSAWGVIIDGELVFSKAFGVRERTKNDPATADTAFRIASMTKSFTAAAVLKLRDAGKLSLDDRVEKWIPEFRNYKYPTSDTQPLRVRQLLSHGAGFPEDNPWGDRQMGEPLDSLGQWVKKGIPFSTPPDTEYEYSNYGFALAGQVVAKASGMPYRKYVEEQILLPLGMKSSSLEPSALPENARAVGYGFRDNEYFVIPSLQHGSFGAMGGLVTTTKDLARWIAFQLSAFPPRDSADTGPVSRASLREMQRLQRSGNLMVEKFPRTRATAGGYGFGLGVSQDCRFEHIVGHGGGLPGFGSYMMWLPEYGVGMLAMTNLTYSGPAQALSEAFDVLQKTGALQPRQWPASPVLTSMRDSLAALYTRWDDDALGKIAANNLAMDLPAARRGQQVAEVRKQAGACQAPGPVEALNLLRGRFRMPCERGDVEVTFTLAPTNPPSIQYLDFSAIGRLTPAMQSYAGEVAAKAGTSCRVGNVLGGDGERNSRVVLTCDDGPRMALLSLAGESKSFQLRRAPGSRCEP